MADELFNLDNVSKTEMSSAPRINTAGIHSNLIPTILFREGDNKKKPGKWQAFSLTVVDEDGFEFTEMYFKPPETPEEVKADRLYPLKKYKMVERRLADIGLLDQKEEMQQLNNEFMSYLLDLGEAFGYQFNDIRTHLFKNATSFKALCEAFIAKFSPKENTRISAKFLYTNSKKAQTSELNIHGPFAKYYPYGNDFFETYYPKQPSKLQFSKYETTNGLVKMYATAGDAPKGKDTINKTEGPVREIDTKGAEIGDDTPF